MARDDDDHLDDGDDSDPAVPGERVLDVEIEDVTATDFDVVDMVALYGNNYALGYEVIDDEYGEQIQVHRHLGAGLGFELVHDEALIQQLIAMSVSDVEEDEDAVSDALTYAIVDTVAVEGATWTLGRALADEEAVPDVFRYEGHGRSFAIVPEIGADLRERIEDAVRGFDDEGEVSYERVDFDLVDMVEHDGMLFALGHRIEDGVGDRPLRVWRHLGDGLGFEIVDDQTPLHAQVTKKFPGLFDDEVE